MVGGDREEMESGGVPGAANQLTVQGVDHVKRQAISQRQMAALREAFALFDRDGSGSIDASELRACLRSLGQYPTPFELDELMQRMDLDGNGQIDFQEFAAAMHEHNEDEELEAELEDLRGVFTLLDKDGNGRLDADELHRAMKILGVEMTSTEAQFLLDLIDTDKDGSVSFEEFAAYVLNFEEQYEEEHHGSHQTP